MNAQVQTTDINLHVADLAGSNHEIGGRIGDSLMEIIRGAGIEDIPAYCGGCCSCASCHVHIDPDFMALLPEMSSDEDDLLDGSPHRGPGSRLSCQIKATSALRGLRLTIAPSE